MRKYGDDWTWVDNSPITWTNWAEDEPSNGSCVMADSRDGNKWSTATCDALMSTLCQLSTGNVSFVSVKFEDILHTNIIDRVENGLYFDPNK